MKLSITSSITCLRACGLAGLRACGNTKSCFAFECSRAEHEVL
jgi:hypothetical protein